MASDLPTRRSRVPHWGWFLGATVLVLGLGILSIPIIRLQLTVAELQEIGFYVNVAGPEWSAFLPKRVRSKIGTGEWLPNGRIVGIYHPHCTEHDLRSVSELRTLESVILKDAEVTDSGLIHLARLKNLKSLSISLRGGVNPTQISDVGLKHISRLPNLQSLMLLNTQITDAGLKHLTGMTSLKRLMPGSIHVTDAGLANLASMTHLQALYLSNTHITDAGLVHLKGMKDLTSLGLSNTQISDSGLEQLHRLRSLQILILEDDKGRRVSKFTPRGIERLKSALPETMIQQ